MLAGRTPAPPGTPRNSREPACPPRPRQPSAGTPARTRQAPRTRTTAAPAPDRKAPPKMTADPGHPPALPGQASPAQHLAAIAAGLSGRAITSRLTRIGGTPVLTIDDPAAGPDYATITVDPGPGLGAGPQLDCTCIWTPAPGTTPQATAATIVTVLNAIRPTPDPGRP